MEHQNVIAVCGLSPRQSYVEFDAVVRERLLAKKRILYICFDRTEKIVFERVIEPAQRHTGYPTDEFSQEYHCEIRRLPSYSVSVKDIKRMVDEAQDRPEVIVVDVAALLKPAFHDHLTYRGNDSYLAELAALADACGTTVITRIHASRQVAEMEF